MNLGVLGDGERMEEDIDSVDFEDAGGDVGSEKMGSDIGEQGDESESLTIDSDKNDWSDENFDHMGYISIKSEENEVEKRSDDPVPDGIGKKSRRASQKAPFEPPELCSVRRKRCERNNCSR